KGEISKIKIVSIKAVSDSELLTFPGFVNKKLVTVLIDCRARGNFISSRIWDQGGSSHNSKDYHQIILADGRTCRASTVKNVNLKVNEYFEHMDFLLALIQHDIILGKPWLDRVNPCIDWKMDTLYFETKDEKTHYWNIIDDNDSADNYP